MPAIYANIRDWLNLKGAALMPHSSRRILMTRVRRNKGGGQNKSPSKDEKLDPLTVMGCFNCDDPNDMVSKCLKKIDLTKTAQRKMEYYSKKRGITETPTLFYSSFATRWTTSEEAEADVQMSIESSDITDSDLFAALVSYVDIPDELLEPEVADNEEKIHIIEGPSDVYVSVEQLDFFKELAWTQEQKDL